MIAFLWKWSIYIKVYYQKYERMFTEIKRDDLWVMGLWVIFNFLFAYLYFQPFYTEHIFIFQIFF